MAYARACVCNTRMKARQYIPKGYDQTLVKPLAEMPRGESGMELLALGETHGVPEPLWPFDDTDNSYFVELQDTLDAMEQAQKGRWPFEFFNKYAAQSVVPIDWDFREVPGPLSALVNTSNPMTLPQLVTMDVPYQLTAEFLHWRIEQSGGIAGVKVREPQCPGHVEFYEVACRHFARSSARVAETMYKAAGCKNFYGVMRPEAVIQAYASPYSVSGTVLTTAPNGCPPHDSYVAGHGTFDGAIVKVWEEDFISTPQEIREVRASGFLHAMGRSILGVHTPQDNLKGFELGYGVYDGEVSITADEFWRAQKKSPDGEVNLQKLIFEKEKARDNQAGSKI